MTTSNSGRRRSRRKSDAPKRSGRERTTPRRSDRKTKHATGVAGHAVGRPAHREALRSDRFRTQAASIIEALREMIHGVFSRGIPADRALAEFLRTHRGCGSRDRAAISATVYAVMRYYGAIRAMLPEGTAAGIEAGNTGFSAEELAALCCCGLIFEGEHGELLHSLARLYALPSPPVIPPDASWEERAAAAAEFSGTGIAPHPDSLLPESLAAATRIDFHRLSRLFARRPPMWIRLQGGDGEDTLQELSEAGLTVKRHPRLSAAVAVSGGKVNIFTLNSFRRGRFEVQDLASQCVGAVCAPRPGERWLDACAGGGGKTLELAELMRRRGTVVAGDVRPGILRQLRLRSRRAGFPNISTLVHNGRIPRGFHACDGVLVDAPCSGSGVWRRNPGSVWKFRLSELAAYTERQLEILRRFSAAVKPGGVLVYATCSIFDAENEEIVNKFLAANPDFALESGTHPLSGAITDGTYRFEGFNDDCDFLFAARMRRKYGAEK